MAIRDADGLQAFFRKHLPAGDAEVAASRLLQTGGISDTEERRLTKMFQDARRTIREGDMRIDPRKKNNATIKRKTAELINSPRQVKGKRLRDFIDKPLPQLTSQQWKFFRFLYEGTPLDELAAA